ncbi:hypothetical protein HAX54_035744 [Datura stramonium]|uniref:Pectinesterase inhibitor domain-containing protein n=1 Tax=Datura stramonium TaxID=4076 RepID=A0ABS8SFL6_DATST|nr:hypothetical protein [Datura stramonium]
MCFSHDLTETAINLAAANASTTAAKVSLLLNETSDPNLEVIYNLCTTYYKWGRADRAFGNAEQYLNKNLNTAANLVGPDAFNCEAAFEVTPGKENDDLQNLGGILVAAANLLSTSLKLLV